MSTRPHLSDSETTMVLILIVCIQVDLFLEEEKRFHILFIVEAKNTSIGVYPPASDPVQCNHALIYQAVKPHW